MYKEKPTTIKSVCTKFKFCNFKVTLLHRAYGLGYCSIVSTLVPWTRNGLHCLEPKCWPLLFACQGFWKSFVTAAFAYSWTRCGDKALAIKEGIGMAGSLTESHTAEYAFKLSISGEEMCVKHTHAHQHTHKTQNSPIEFNFVNTLYSCPAYFMKQYSTRWNWLYIHKVTDHCFFKTQNANVSRSVCVRCVSPSLAWSLGIIVAWVTGFFLCPLNGLSCPSCWWDWVRGHPRQPCLVNQNSLSANVWALFFSPVDS